MFSNDVKIQQLVKLATNNETVLRKSITEVYGGKYITILTDNSFITIRITKHVIILDKRKRNEG